MLKLIEAITIAAVIAVDLVAVTHALSRSPGRRLLIAGLAGGWTGLAAALGAAGLLAFDSGLPVPLIGVLLAGSLLAVGVLALTQGSVRASLLGIPLELLIGLNVMRLLGALFLLDLAAGTLSGPFPYFAGGGDVITGAIAIPLALNVARGKASVRAIARWNAFGALDLIVAVTLGITSAAGSPLLLFHAGVGSGAVQFLPLCLVPTVLVPFYLLTHAVIVAQVRVRSPSAQGARSGGAASKLAVAQAASSQP